MLEECHRWHQGRPPQRKAATEEAPSASEALRACRGGKVTRLELSELPTHISCSGFFAGEESSKAIPDAYGVRVGLDCNNKGAKHWAGFSTGGDLIAFEEWFRTTPNVLRPAGASSCLYEVVRTTSTPTHMAFDLDRDLNAAELTSTSIDTLRLETRAAFLRVAQVLLRRLSRNPDLRLQPGVNCQFSESRYDVSKKAKLSIHAVFYVQQPCDWQLCGMVAVLLNAYIVRALPEGADRRLLVKADGNFSIVDTTIYHNHRCMRMLRNSKRGPLGSPLVPAEGSADGVQHHLVCSYDDLPLPEGAEPFQVYAQELPRALADLPQRQGDGREDEAASRAPSRAAAQETVSGTTRQGVEGSGATTSQ